jgi:hypothetical protein
MLLCGWTRTVWLAAGHNSARLAMQAAPQHISGEHGAWAETGGVVGGCGWGEEWCT